jgi:hypothetical protein
VIAEGSQILFSRMVVRISSLFCGTMLKFKQSSFKAAHKNCKMLHHAGNKMVVNGQVMLQQDVLHHKQLILIDM